MYLVIQYSLKHATDTACINSCKNLIQKLRKNVLKNVFLWKKDFYLTKLVLEVSQLWEWATFFQNSLSWKRGGTLIRGGALNRKNTVYHDWIDTYEIYHINCDHSWFIWTALISTSTVLYQWFITRCYHKRYRCDWGKMPTSTMTVSMRSFPVLY